jgi:hypothetical protein
MAFVPAVRPAGIVRFALPVASRVAVPTEIPSMENVIVPSGVPFGEVAIALRLRLWFAKAGFGLTATVVVDARRFTTNVVGNADEATNVASPE